MCRLSIESLKANSVANINTANSLQKSIKQFASRRKRSLTLDPYSYLDYIPLPILNTFILRTTKRKNEVRDRLCSLPGHGWCLHGCQDNVSHSFKYSQWPLGILQTQARELLKIYFRKSKNIIDNIQIQFDKDFYVDGEGNPQNN